MNIYIALLAIIIAILSIFITFKVGRYEIKIIKKTKSIKENDDKEKIGIELPYVIFICIVMFFLGMLTVISIYTSPDIVPYNVIRITPSEYDVTSGMTSDITSDVPIPTPTETNNDNRTINVITNNETNNRTINDTIILPILISKSNNMSENRSYNISDILIVAPHV